MRSLYGAIVNYKIKKIMAISINKVYQKVLALANKEQRGYITPQEFNLFADYAQMEIFEQYFYNLEQRQRGAGNSTPYADIQENIEEKLSAFEKYDELLVAAAQSAGFSSHTLNRDDYYRLGIVKARYTGQTGGFSNYGNPSQVIITTTFESLCTKLSFKEINDLAISPLTRPTKERPVYSLGEHPTGTILPGIKIRVYPATSEVFITYITKPTKPNWTYVISGENALYNDFDINLQDFELHVSEEVNLVNKILQLAGVSIKDAGLTQLAGNKDRFITQQQKQ